MDFVTVFVNLEHFLYLDNNLKNCFSLPWLGLLFFSRLLLLLLLLLMLMLLFDFVYLSLNLLSWGAFLERCFSWSHIWQLFSGCCMPNTIASDTVWISDSPRASLGFVEPPFPRGCVLDILHIRCSHYHS